MIQFQKDSDYITRILRVLSLEDIQRLSSNFRCNLEGIHGLRHWTRVAINALMLSDHEGGADAVAVLFAFFHDLERDSEYGDPDHGSRGAISFLQSEFSKKLSQYEIDIVLEACKWHTHGKRSEDKEIGLLWDADRLDLRRVLVTPEDPFLSTETARDPRVKIWTDREGVSFLNRDLLEAHLFGDFA